MDEEQFDTVAKETAKLINPIIKDMDKTRWLIGKALYEAKQQTPRGQKGEVMRLVWKNVRDETELSRQDLKKCLDYYESNLGLYK